MNKNTINKLVNNPHYTMGEEEIMRLSVLLQEEALAQDETNNSDEEFQISAPVLKTNKNRIAKVSGKIVKHSDLEE